ncbi:molybdopterin-guanine dinucleotide biosynthesis protein B [Paucidesulfovibrio gracilis DSM 16080]|uniref:Molybdopterin-guanine dinucleotide biosynthesis protein B n=1 Tax=Paucidesulfovibrio gracilis DSM 16080 TaxID=1121449 RepID=A0A1T4W8H4_9BACT|nr:molybdopterin-guanine dinucleotide biosynthesis protein MobB [Paucidesulfovibrio gracilis]SKA73582.1 molybdopterin-guanine dinucleotide biosynthesis protein B [Paucidesulfovibrio gracilis DSM 16080]
MKAISLVGYKNSGKTSLGLELVRILRQRGHSVAVAKCSSHGFSETEDTDTRRYKDVAQTVLGLSESESFISWPEQRDLLRLLPLLETDVLVVEGGKTLGYLPRVILSRAGVNPEPVDDKALDPSLALATFGDAQLPGTPHLQDAEALADLVLDKGFLLPGLSCGGCGRKGCRGLARDIVAGRATVEECVATGGEVDITVNGAPLPLNPFVARMLGAGLKGMLAELKGYSAGKVKIEFDG